MSSDIKTLSFRATLKTLMHHIKPCAQDIAPILCFDENAYFLQRLIFKDMLLFLVDGIYFAPFRSP